MSETDSTFAHAAAALDFAAVLDLVAAGCVNDAARARVRALHPSDDPDVVVAGHAEVDEMRRLREDDGDVPIASSACRADVERAVGAREEVAPECYLAIAAAEQAVADAMAMLARHAGDAPRLATLGAALTPHPDLVAAIVRAIDADGSIKDDASPALRAIRRDILGLRGSLRTLSERLVDRFGEGTMATVLGSRYVVLVPRRRIRKGDGLVHAASQTGESLYFEPFNLVERNNELETRVGDERAEQARILDALRADVRAVAPAILANLDVVDRLDVLRAAARFAENFRCAAPLPSAQGRIRLVDARHPVLEDVLSRQQGRDLVPLGLTLEPGRRVMVITGPNAGGKTVALKTLGVAVLLFQCGLPVPCTAGSELPVFERVFADIGDEQSMTSSLSTFTSHLRHLDRMNRHAGAGTLCLIDEIGDGTDPDEGAALAIATLERLLERGAAVVATTHYGRIKTFALQMEGVENASMAFEDGEARPLYRLLQGVAGRSRGLETARRSGFEPEVVRRAETYVGADAFRLDAVLGDLERTLRDLEAERERVERRSHDLDRLVAEYQAKAAEFDMTRREATRRAAREAEEMVRQARREAEHIVREIRERQAERRVVRDAKRRLGRMIDDAQRTREANEETQRPHVESVAPGDRVSLSPKGTPAGVVVSVENGDATVEINNKRITLRVAALYEAAPPPGGRTPDETVHIDFQVDPLTSTDLDVRGRERDDALAEVGAFLDRAVVTGVQQVRIIHGVGGGVLSRAVKEMLRGDRRVASFRSGELAEGGQGVTIVRFD